MRKTTVICNEQTTFTVSHPDWNEQELAAKLRATVKDVTSVRIVADDVTEFPDLEFSEQGERLFSFVDFING